jgi:hypothetical protein
VSEPQTEAGRALLGRQPPKPRTAWFRCADDILEIERQAVAAWLDTEAEGLLAEALTTCEIGCVGFGGFHDGNTGQVHHARDAADLVAHLRERMTP